MRKIGNSTEYMEGRVYSLFKGWSCVSCLNKRIWREERWRRDEEEKGSKQQDLGNITLLQAKCFLHHPLGPKHPVETIVFLFTDERGGVLFVKYIQEIKAIHGEVFISRIGMDRYEYSRAFIIRDFLR